MLHKHIIADAWHLVQKEPGLSWYGTIPAFFSIVVGSLIVCWQIIAFQTSEFFGGKDLMAYIQPVLSWGKEFVVAHPAVTVGLVIVAVLFGLAYLVLPVLCDTALIGIAAAYERDIPVTPRAGLRVGMARFFALLEFRAATAIFSFMEVFTLFSLVVRHIGASTALFIFFGVYAFFSLVLFVLLLYAEQYIVLKKQGVTESSMSSIALLFNNLDHTFFIGIFMGMIAGRIILTTALVLLIPLVVFFVAGFVITKVSLGVGVFLGILVGGALVAVASHLLGSVHIFIQTVWTIAFERLEKEAEVANQILG